MITVVNLFAWLQVVSGKQSPRVCLQCRSLAAPFAGTSSTQNCKVHPGCLRSKSGSLQWSCSHLCLNRIRPSTWFGFKLLLVTATAQSRLMLIHWSAADCPCSHLVSYCQRNAPDRNVSRAHAQQLRRKERVFCGLYRDKKRGCKWEMNYEMLK